MSKFCVKTTNINKNFLRVKKMKYIFAGNWLEYKKYIEQQEENGYFEVSKIEHIEKIPVGGTLLVTGHYANRKIWLEIAPLIKIKAILVKEV